MATEESSCTLPERDRLLLAYLGGTISDEDAERLEAHAMTCDECASELEHGVAIRAALEEGRGVAPVATPVARTPIARRIDWRWLAAAATIVLSVSIWRFAGSDRAALEQATPAATPTSAPASTPAGSPVPPLVATPAAPPRLANRPPLEFRNTLRTKSSSVQPVAARETTGEIRLHWPAVDKAAHYIVTIFATNASQLFRHEVATPEIAIDAATAAFPGHADEQVYAQVEAIDALGVTLGTSKLIIIPARRDEIPPEINQ